MLRLNDNEEKNAIFGRDLQDGEMGVVVASSQGHYVGRVVQRIKYDFCFGGKVDVLVTLGAGSTRAWCPASTLTDTFKVRLIKPGQTFVLE